MYCLKCGREVYEDQVFCSDCIAVMEKYPVKPGTVILLPKRREGNGGSRPTVRRKTLTAEEQIRKLEGVNSASVNFLTQKLTLDAEDARLESVLDEAERIIKKIEPDCVLVR